MFNNLYEKVKDFIKRYKEYLIVLIVVGICFIPLDYVIYSPGGYISVKDRLNVATDNTSGDINMAYVTVRNAKLPTAILALFLKNWDLYPQEAAAYEGTDYDQTLEIEKLQMQNAISSAVIYAYQKAGANITLNKENIYVISVLDEAKTDIKVLDKIISLDGTQVTSLAQLHELIKDKKENDVLKIVVERDGKEVETSSTLYAYGDSLVVGISLIVTYDYEADPSITLSSKASELGSSGGLMMSLAIYNSLTEEDITGGKKIVGTGTIDIDGNVGEIGGVKYKLLGAKSKKADVFICPQENYTEAQKYNEEYNLGMEIVGVATFDDVINYFTNN